MNCVCVFWGKYVNRALFGAYVQGACVENVLDSVVVALHRDPNRKFVFAEMVKQDISNI